MQSFNSGALNQLESRCDCYNANSGNGNHLEIHHITDESCAVTSKKNSVSTTSAIWGDTKKINLICRVCDADESMTHVTTVAHFCAELGNVDFYKCDTCGSLNAITSKFLDYTSENISDSNWDHYFHCGAGIDSITGLLETAGIQAGATLLDVGCGVGFSLDYWKEMGGGEAIGLEASEYGKLGSRLLGTKIYPKYLIEAEEIRGRRFDRIISSEVIEHVDDPISFLVEIRPYLADDGVLILTTPNADFVNEKNSLSSVLGVLSPGLHRMLFSKQALSCLLDKVGFPYHEVRIEHERLVAYASHTSLVLSGENRRARYKDYLKKRGNTANDYVFGLGLAYRAFKELVNDGHFDEALPYGRKIIAATKDKFGLNPASPKSCLAIVGRCATLNEYGESAPFFLPSFVFYLSMAARHGYSIEEMDPAEGFACAAALCEDAQRIAPLFSQEAASLYWPAVYEEGSARLYAEDRETALGLFERVQQGPNADQPYLAYTLRSEELSLRAMVQSGVAVLQMGNPESAMNIFRNALSKAIALSSTDVVNEILGLWQVAKSQAEEMFTRQIPDSSK